MPDKDASLGDREAAAGLFPINLTFADYDRTRPLSDGRVKPKGIALRTTITSPADFCLKPVYEEYDVAEMSFSWYVAARDRGEPVWALPIFPLRMAVWGFVFVRTDSNITKPSDLIGKRIGTQQGYRYTVNLWLRGLFAEHYGFRPEQATWITTEEETAGFVIPEGINYEIIPDRAAEENLKDGTVDAIFCTGIPKQFHAGETWIRRLFPDAQAEMNRFTRATGIMPITHVMVMREDLTRNEPWLAKSLFDAFTEAQDLATQFLQLDPKKLSLPESLFALEENRETYGANPYAHGIAPNRKIIETFLRYAHEQGYISRPMPLEDLFPANTLNF